MDIACLIIKFYTAASQELFILKAPQVTSGLKDVQVPGLQAQAHFALDLAGWYKLEIIKIINFLLWLQLAII